MYGNKRYLYFVTMHVPTLPAVLCRNGTRFGLAGQLANIDTSFLHAFMLLRLEALKRDFETSQKLSQGISRLAEIQLGLLVMFKSALGLCP